MKLYPRQPDDKDDRDQTMRAWAHRLLDQVKRGVYHEPELIEAALKLTGDST